MAGEGDEEPTAVMVEEDEAITATALPPQTNPEDDHKEGEDGDDEEEDEDTEPQQNLEAAFEDAKAHRTEAPCLQARTVG